MCVFHSDNSEAPRIKSKPEQETVGSVRSNQKLGCVSQDVELPEQTV